MMMVFLESHRCCPADDAKCDVCDGNYQCSKAHFPLRLYSQYQLMQFHNVVCRYSAVC